MAKDIQLPLLQQEAKKKSKRRCCVLVTCILIVISAVLSIRFFLPEARSKKADATDCNPGHNLNTDEFKINQTLCRLLAGTNDDSGSENNVYITKAAQNVTEREACGIESVLRLTPDRNVFVIDLNYGRNDTNDSTRFDYMGHLFKLYKNLHVLKINSLEFFKDTGFEGITCWNRSTQFAAKLVTAYKFGGVVLSLNTVMVNRKLFTCNGDTLIDERVLVTPKRCNDFVDYLMHALLVCNQNYVGPEARSIPDIIRESYELYCDPASECKNLKLFGQGAVCDHVSDRCDVFKLNRFSKLPAKTVQEELPLYCRQVVKNYLQEQLSTKEVEDDLSNVKKEILVLEKGRPSC